MDPKAILRQALRELPAPAWQQSPVSGNECFLAAAVALAAYAHPAPHELKETGRAILVPSDTFRDCVSTGSSLSSASLREEDLGAVFVETRFFVAALVKVRDFVVVGYRGTADLYDLFLDIQFRKVGLPSFSGLRPKVHTGFLKAFLEGFPAVLAALKQLEPFETLVGSGHSLGGAMCSLHNTLSNQYSNRITNPRHLIDAVMGPELDQMSHCVTFGSPNVGNIQHAAFHEWGDHFVHPGDPIPMLPGRALGYRVQPRRIPLVNVSGGTATEGPRFLALRRKRRLIQVSAHNMERYVQSCAAAAGSQL